MAGTITVKGTGQLKIAPDQVRITVQLSEKKKEAEKAAAAADEKAGAVKRTLAQAGFASDELKTLSFNVAPEYIWDKNGNRRQNGFRCDHILRLTFPMNREKVREVMDLLACCEASPAFDVQFTLKEPEGVRDELLRLASENARKKAEVLCAASGAKLGKLTQISYGVSSVELISPMAVRFEKAAGVSNDRAVMSEEYIPEDIEASDDATFTWELD